MSLVSRGLAQSITAVRVNRSWIEKVDGVATCFKHRRMGMNTVIRAGNQFLRLANSHIQMFVEPNAWLTWEQQSMALLHPDLRCGKIDERTLWMQALPGESLRELALKNALTPEMMNHLGRHLAGLHALYFEPYRGPWSHGDIHLDNVLYDAASQTYAVIDFETQHVSHLSTRARHADDLLVLVLDVMGLPQCDWMTCVQALLEGYDAPKSGAMLQLQQRVARVPRGWELVLWQSRCGQLKRSELSARFNALHQHLVRLGRRQP